VAAVPFEVALLDTSPPPVYQRLARKALHLQQLGLCFSDIAGRLGVTDETVAKGISWLSLLSRQARGCEES
jgi:orotate phosphoribosyltransferase-like protein